MSSDGNISADSMTSQDVWSSFAVTRHRVAKADAKRAAIKARPQQATHPAHAQSKTIAFRQRKALKLVSQPTQPHSTMPPVRPAERTATAASESKPQAVASSARSRPTAGADASIAAEFFNFVSVGSAEETHTPGASGTCLPRTAPTTAQAVHEWHTHLRSQTAREVPPAPLRPVPLSSVLHPQGAGASIAWRETHQRPTPPSPAKQAAAATTRQRRQRATRVVTFALPYLDHRRRARSCSPAGSSGSQLGSLTGCTADATHQPTPTPRAASVPVRCSSPVLGSQSAAAPSWRKPASHNDPSCPRAAEASTGGQPLGSRAAEASTGGQPLGSRAALLGGGTGRTSHVPSVLEHDMQPSPSSSTSSMNTSQLAQRAAARGTEVRHTPGGRSKLTPAAGSAAAPWNVRDLHSAWTRRIGSCGAPVHSGGDVAPLQWAAAVQRALLVGPSAAGKDQASIAQWCDAVLSGQCSWRPAVLRAVGACLATERLRREAALGELHRQMQQLQRDLQAHLAVAQARAGGTSLPRPGSVPVDGDLKGPLVLAYDDAVMSTAQHRSDTGALPAAHAVPAQASMHAAELSSAPHTARPSALAAAATAAVGVDAPPGLGPPYSSSIQLLPSALHTSPPAAAPVVRAVQTVDGGRMVDFNGAAYTAQLLHSALRRARMSLAWAALRLEPVLRSYRAQLLHAVLPLAGTAMLRLQLWAVLSQGREAQRRLCAQAEAWRGCRLLLKACAAVQRWRQCMLAGRRLRFLSVAAQQLQLARPLERCWRALMCHAHVQRASRAAHAAAVTLQDAVVRRRVFLRWRQCARQRRLRQLRAERLLQRSGLGTAQDAGAATMPHPLHVHMGQLSSKGASQAAHLRNTLMELRGALWRGAVAALPRVVQGGGSAALYSAVWQAQRREEEAHNVRAGEARVLLPRKAALKQLWQGLSTVPLHTVFRRGRAGAVHCALGTQEAVALLGAAPVAAWATLVEQRYGQLQLEYGAAQGHGGAVGRGFRGGSQHWTQALVPWATGVMQQVRGARAAAGRLPSQGLVRPERSTLPPSDAAPPPYSAGSDSGLEQGDDSDLGESDADEEVVSFNRLVCRAGRVKQLRRVWGRLRLGCALRRLQRRRQQRQRDGAMRSVFRALQVQMHRGTAAATVAASLGCRRLQQRLFGRLRAAAATSAQAREELQMRTSARVTARAAWSGWRQAVAWARLLRHAEVQRHTLVRARAFATWRRWLHAHRAQQGMTPAVTCALAELQSAWRWRRRTAVLQRWARVAHNRRTVRRVLQLALDARAHREVHGPDELTEDVQNMRGVLFAWSAVAKEQAQQRQAQAMASCASDLYCMRLQLSVLQAWKQAAARGTVARRHARTLQLHRAFKALQVGALQGQRSALQGTQRLQGRRCGVALLAWRQLAVHSVQVRAFRAARGRMQARRCLQGWREASRDARMCVPAAHARHYGIKKAWRALRLVALEGKARKVTVANRCRSVLRGWNAQAKEEHAMFRASTLLYMLRTRQAVSRWQAQAHRQQQRRTELVTRLQLMACITRDGGACLQLEGASSDDKGASFDMEPLGPAHAGRNSTEGTSDGQSTDSRDWVPGAPAGASAEPLSALQLVDVELQAEGEERGAAGEAACSSAGGVGGRELDVKHMLCVDAADCAALLVLDGSLSANSAAVAEPAMTGAIAEPTAGAARHAAEDQGASKKTVGGDADSRCISQVGSEVTHVHPGCMPAHTPWVPPGPVQGGAHTHLGAAPRGNRRGRAFKGQGPHSSSGVQVKALLRQVAAAGVGAGAWAPPVQGGRVHLTSSAYDPQPQEEVEWGVGAVSFRGPALMPPAMAAVPLQPPATTPQHGKAASAIRDLLQASQRALPR